MTKTYHNQIFYQSSASMSQLPDSSIDLIITPPPYFTIKDYSKKGGRMKLKKEANGQMFFELTTSQAVTDRKKEDVGNIPDYQAYLSELTKIWQECERVLKPNGKLCINVPFRNALNKVNYSLSFDIHRELVEHTNLAYYDRFVWDKSNRIFMYQKGSWPYPGQINSWILRSEDILVFVKSGAGPKRICEQSLITKEEFQQWIRPVWVIPTSRDGLKTHVATFPLELVKRLIKLYSFVGDTILDPFAGSGTTLCSAQQLGRHYVGYELYQHYQPLIQQRLGMTNANNYEHF